MVVASLFGMGMIGAVVDQLEILGGDPGPGELFVGGITGI
jgi:hypothetical protein